MNRIIERGVDFGKNILKSKVSGAVLLGTIAITSGYNIYKNHNKSALYDVLAERQIAHSIQNAEKTRQEIEQKYGENISTLIVINVENGNMDPIFVPTRYVTDWSPKKTQSQWIGDIINQDVPYLGNIYTGTLALQEGEVVWNKNISIQRTVGDHASDADDYRILKDGTLLPNISVIAHYSSKNGNTPQMYNTMIPSAPVSVIQNSQEKTNNILNQ